MGKIFLQWPQNCLHQSIGQPCKNSLPKNRIGRSFVVAPGRSYGDSSLAETIVSSRFLDSFAEFNSADAIVDCGAGVTLGDILKLAIPKGLFLPVLPGTKTVSVGGAIAADIHGKNHHIDGCFSNFVISFNLLLASGEVIQCSQVKNTELFRATCGGMGLTGVILSARIQLEKVSSVTINQRSLVASDLDSCLDILDAHNESKYSVAWVDCLASKQSLGRSIVYLGEHGDDDNLQVRIRRSLSVPFSTPSFLLNKYTMKAFNSSYFAIKGKNVDSRPVAYDFLFFSFRYYSKLEPLIWSKRLPAVSICGSNRSWESWTKRSANRS